MKKTAFSILDLVLVPEGKNFKQTLEDTVILAQKAESFGYNRIWFAEHHNMAAVASNSPQVLIASIAQATKTIQVGSGGIMLPNHSPLVIAEQFGTLGTLYPNRINLGLGRAPGTDPETARAIRTDFMQAAHSFPQEVEKIQRFFSLENKQSKVRAVIAEGVNVPICILGSSPDSAHLAAKKGLPYAFASHFATAHLFNALSIYRDEFKASEKLQAPYVIAGVNVFVADTDEEATVLATSFFKMIVSLLTNARRENLAKPSTMTEELREIQEHPAVKQMTRYSFIGSKETVKTEVSQFIEQTQADELIVVSAIHDADARIKSYQYFSEIMKVLNDK